MTATDTYLLLRAFCDELARCGLRHACTSPGSRNSPLVLSLVREPRIATWSHIDERCAGFFALGAARATGAAVAMTCTSGTAAANFAPAVIEAHEARVPLLVLTADRPPELREVGAGQAIDQIKLYGDAVRWFVEVGVDQATPANLRWIRQLACRAHARASGPLPGPVHLNFPLREPLVLTSPLPEDPVAGRDDGRPWVTVSDPRPRTGARARSLPPRSVVIAGRAEHGGGAGRAAARFAAATGYPLLADALSAARRDPGAIATYDLLLRDPELAARLAPELVIRVGDLPTSKPLRQWLAGLAGVPQVAIGSQAAGQDPAAALTEVVSADPAATLAAWTPEADPRSDWQAAWRAADERARAAIDRALGDQLSEPLVARCLGEWLGPEATLVVASSMPIRDVELFLGTGPQLPRVLANRGANGIDGTVSTAFGVAAAGGGPVVLLTGDVALAHDLGGLLAHTRLGLELKVVLLNNDGGGIFHFLPVSGEGEAFEAHVATPHGLEFAHAAALYGLRHRHVATVPELREALGAPGAAILEVRTDRRENLALHRAVADAGLQAARAELLTPDRAELLTPDRAEPR